MNGQRELKVSKLHPGLYAGKCPGCKEWFMAAKRTPRCDDCWPEFEQKQAERRTKKADAVAEASRLRAALEAALLWHESEDKALSKSGRSDLDYQWRRLQHKEQIESIQAALSTPLSCLALGGSKE